jgi:hypothetical protein
MERVAGQAARRAVEEQTSLLANTRLQEVRHAAYVSQIEEQAVEQDRSIRNMIDQYKARLCEIHKVSMEGGAHPIWQTPQGGSVMRKIDQCQGNAKRKYVKST